MKFVVAALGIVGTLCIFSAVWITRPNWVHGLINGVNWIVDLQAKVNVSYAKLQSNRRVELENELSQPRSFLGYWIREQKLAWMRTRSRHMNELYRRVRVKNGFEPINLLDRQAYLVWQNVDRHRRDLQQWLEEARQIKDPPGLPRWTWSLTVWGTVLLVLSYLISLI